MGTRHLLPITLVVVTVATGIALMWSSPDRTRHLAEPELAEPALAEPESEDILEPSAPAPGALPGPPAPPPEMAAPQPEPEPAAPQPEPEPEPEPAAPEPAAPEPSAEDDYASDPRRVLDLPEHLDEASEEEQREYFEKLLVHHEAMLGNARAQLEHLESRLDEEPELEQHLGGLRKGIADAEAQTELLRERLAQ